MLNPFHVTGSLSEEDGLELETAIRRGSVLEKYVDERHGWFRAKPYAEAEVEI